MKQCLLLIIEILKCRADSGRRSSSLTQHAFFVVHEIGCNGYRCAYDLLNVYIESPKKRLHRSLLLNADLQAAACDQRTGFSLILLAHVGKVMMRCHLVLCNRLITSKTRQCAR